MKIEIIPCLNDNYSYLIFEEITNTVSIVDPSEFETCNEFIQKYKKLDYILNTHHHADHIGGNLALKKKYNSKIIGFNADKNRIPGIDIYLKENQSYSIGNLTFETIFLPGHTKGHIAFYFKKEKVVFTGDTLFSLGCGRVFEGSQEDMFRSLNKLKKLPQETKIYCGHEYTKSNSDFCIKYDPGNKLLKDKMEIINQKYKTNSPTIPTTIHDELKMNIFLRCNNSDIKETLGLQDSSEQEVFTKLRELKDNF
tara:strand:- start:74 stop:832 length:759 start_codon:yes stop_codon:yes gene_type:complete